MDADATRRPLRRRLRESMIVIAAYTGLVLALSGFVAVASTQSCRNAERRIGARLDDAGAWLRSNLSLRPACQDCPPASSLTSRPRRPSR